MIDDYHLESAFKYNSGQIIEFKDINKVVAEVPGEADGPDWHWILETNDGRLFLAEGVCDYSGWD
jgi:hypothetical protein